jgi:hypothetical protein
MQADCREKRNVRLSDFVARAFTLFALVHVAIPAHATCDSNQQDATPDSRYEIKGAEVYDTKTDLTWQRCSIGQQWRGDLGCVGVISQMNWKEAMNHATAAWQLPTKDELSSLVSSACTNPAINENAFPDMELNKLWYWTRTPNDALVWYVAFGGGSLRSGGPLDLNSVRLVRHGR